jgi:cyclopropane fatty-acyl-phospholipid synthase-like methyltransferase
VYVRPELTVIQQAVFKHIPSLGLAPGAHILDTPCGAAAGLSIALTEKGFVVVGADVEPNAGGVLGDRFEKVDLNHTWPWADGMFDAVISTEGIEHLENHFAFLREACRVLRPGGLLVLTTPNITALRSRVRFVGSGFFGRDSRPLNESGRHPLQHIGLATFPELRYELHVSGFHLLEVRHTHIKSVNYLYSIYVPWMWLYTRIAFRKERDPSQRERNREIRKTLLSSSLLFGECLMLVGKKL